MLWSNLKIFNSPRFLKYLTIWDGGIWHLYIRLSRQLHESNALAPLS